jgi:hypothetical protein
MAKNNYTTNQAINSSMGDPGFITGLFDADSSFVLKIKKKILDSLPPPEGGEGGDYTGWGTFKQ